ncbi:putative Zinc finger, SWIM domain protein [Desulfamplus magnetovallimortis]|uniref:Putative Zinc finger, SWIM domain protein n=1 Tax=Desulfamplus magnetovallimortis TaxID=1246637 RepID=A0A1W1HIC5_9BACT|nr:hypothetical protein [Desulfamplus magnetovallimortis]SLM32229.1 putative Zinc finger, SWIM domain protein [Desulfamplus magnetovallimortis]
MPELFIEMDNDMIINGLNDSLIKRHSTASSYKKGEKYFKKEQILSMERHGNRLISIIQGEDPTPRKTDISFDEGGLLKLSCNCNAEKGYWCDHIVATLLGAFHDPDKIVHRPALKELLQKKDGNTLKKIIHKIAENNSDMEHLFIRYLIESDDNDLLSDTNTMNDPGSGLSLPANPLVDPAPFASKVTYIIKKYEGQHRDYEGLEQISEVMNEALDFIKQGDGRSAISVMEGIIEGYVKQWFNLDGSYGDTGLFFEDLDMGMAKAILCTAITKDDRKKLNKKIAVWEDNVTGYGIEHPFVLSKSALQQGWDDPILQKILDGETVTESLWPVKIPEHAPIFTLIRLEILEIRKQYSEYLNLALHEKCYFEYLMMLTKTGQCKEAIKNADKMLRSGREALTLAEALREQGLLEYAMEIARIGISLDKPPSAQLALWLSERCDAVGDREEAVNYMIVAFKSAPSFNDFLRIREMCENEKWPAIRNQLLKNLGKGNSFFSLSDIIDIFIHENMINRAISLVDKETYCYREVIRVLEAAIKEKPEWVIENASKRAEEILDSANAKHYNKAVNFLKKARKAYKETKAVDIWNDYKDNLLKKHSRKSKFKGLMEKL